MLIAQASSFGSVQVRMPQLKRGNLISGKTTHLKEDGAWRITHAHRSHLNPRDVRREETEMKSRKLTVKKTEESKRSQRPFAES